MASTCELYFDTKLKQKKEEQEEKKEIKKGKTVFFLDDEPYSIYMLKQNGKAT